ncbi:MAG: DNA-processing protein DprA [Clostridia bacterium]|nr:DNA-processing protein DprA [Clostridia bacterium]
MNLYDIWFSNLDISNKNKLKLLEKFESSEIIWSLNKRDLEDLEFSEKCTQKIFDDVKKRNLDKYSCFMEKNGISLILCNSEKYPNSLKVIENRPAFLYVRGRLENLYEDCASIVGSRDASYYGRFVARKIAKELADRNVNVVSGLALGIDKYAHLGALDSNVGKTIAVLGTGIGDNDIYPFENKKVFERILENDGTIISEFKLGTKPEKYNFPMRNRIISGLSKKVIVVEAKENSGSLITVNYALEQGKDIFAVPGNITSLNSSGTNKLISEGAQIFTGIDEIFLLEN